MYYIACSRYTGKSDEIYDVDFLNILAGKMKNKDLIFVQGEPATFICGEEQKE
jgi:hypothetical protein